MPYAVIVTSSEQRSGSEGNPIITKDGDRFWACVEPEGWVEATSSRYVDDTHVPGDVKTFANEKAAETFAKRWTGHPWWCSPRGEFEIVMVEAIYKSVHAGYKRS